MPMRLEQFAAVIHVRANAPCPSPCPLPASGERRTGGETAALIFLRSPEAMKSLSPRCASAFLRRRVKRGLEAATSLRDARRVFDLQLPYAEPAGGFRPERIGGVAGEWAGQGGATLLYLHGGAFFAGSPRHSPIASAFASLGFNVFTPAYRLAPRHPFPAALDDALRRLRGAGRTRPDRDRREIGRRRPRSVVDDFAPRRRPAAPRRRGFVFALDRSFRHRRLGARKRGERPAVFSPHAETRPAPISRNRVQKPTGVAALRRFARAAAAAAACERKRIAARRCVRLAARAVEAGVDARVALWPDAPHCWQLAAALMPQARELIQQAAGFLREKPGA